MTFGSNRIQIEVLRMKYREDIDRLSKITATSSSSSAVPHLTSELDVIYNENKNVGLL